MDKFIEQRASFPNKPFKPFAVKLWTELFKMAENFVDVAVCNNNGNGSTVNLCLRDSSISDSDYYALDMADIPFAHIGVDGIDERLFAIPDDDDLDDNLQKLTAEVNAWMEKGIIEAFLTPSIQKKYKRYNPDGKRFSIFGDCYETGAFGPDLTLLWSHQKQRFTVAQLQKRQRDARRKMDADEEVEEKKIVIKVKPKPKKKSKKRFPKPFKSVALRGWDDLFAKVATFHNVIRFELSAKAGVVKVITYPPSEKPQCVSMLITTREVGLIEDEDEQAKGIQEFYTWVEKGILDSFKSARIQKKYTKFNPDGKNCAAIISKKEEPGATEYKLTSLDLSILWTNNPKFTISRIKTQQKERDKKVKIAERKRKAAEKRKARAVAKAHDSTAINKLIKQYFKKPFKPHALKIWTEFFEDTEEFHNIAHWQTCAGVGATSLSPQHSTINEKDSERRNNRPSYHVHLFNWDRMLKKGIDQDLATLVYCTWVEQGIMKAFTSKRIQNKFNAYNPDDKSFAILTTQEIYTPMIDDELKVLWNNKPSFTLNRILSQQKTAIKKKKGTR